MILPRSVPRLAARTGGASILAWSKVATSLTNGLAVAEVQLVLSRLRRGDQDVNALAAFNLRHRTAATRRGRPLCCCGVDHAEE